jgi:ATP-dependent DNA ligase
MTSKLPSGSQWLHEIKHDGFRIIARKTGRQPLHAARRPGGRSGTERLFSIISMKAELI